MEKSIEEELRAYRIALSADGRYVAAACIDKGYFLSLMPDKHPSKYYIAVFDGKTGSEVSRLRLDGTEGFALSPKADLLAVVVREYSKNETIPTVHIYDVASGRKLVSVVHDHVSGDNTFLTGGCTVAFTPDSKYLLTSGMVTKLWKLAA